MAELRPRPTIWVSWLRNYLHGSNHCTWAIWRMIHYLNDWESDFDRVGYAIKHTALLKQVKKRYIDEGYEIIPEQKITVSGAIAKLEGSIDLLAIKENQCTVIEVKTGQQNPSDKVQTLLYIWALPRALPRFKGMYFDGKLIYESREIDISSLEIDEHFVKNFSDFTKEIVSGEPDRKFPSAQNCKFCKIRECDERYIHEPSDQSNFVADFF